jgi:uncharacterized membrane protein YfhO
MKTINTHNATKEYLKKYFLPYTLLFLILQGIIFFTFYSSSRSFIWYYDGAYQHYPTLSYYSEFLRNILSGAKLPMVDFSIGLGYDTLTSLNYYVMGDPLTLISALAPPKSLDFVYSFLILLRFFLAGFAFSLFCYYKKQASFSTVLGSLIYVFSSFALFAGLRHPFFLNPLIYLPLLLIGIERLIIMKKGLCFCSMIALSAISNFYFLYMLSIIVFIYALVIYIFNNRNNEDVKEPISIKLRNFCLVFLRSLGYYVLGIGLAGVLLFPTIYAFLHNGRIATGGEALSLLHYDYLYYRSLPKILFTFGQGASNWTVFGVCVLVALCAVIALFNTRKLNPQKVFFAICFIFLMIPFFGKVMNGFSAVSNRWCFAFTFLLAYFVVAHYHSLFALNRKIMYIMSGFVIVYCSFSIFLGDIYVWIPTIFLGLMFIWIMLCNYIPKLSLLRDGLILLLVCLNLITSSKQFLDPYGLNYSEQFIPYGGISKLSISPAKDYLPAMDGEFYRIQDNLVNAPNLSFTSHQYGNAFYLSLLSDNVFQYMLELQNASLRCANQYLGMDDRSFLLTLNGVKYYITNDSFKVPYGFTLKQHVTDNAQNFYIYENKYALPLGYTYDSYLTYEQYEKLTALEKQEALMQCIVIEKDSKTIGQGNPQYSITKVPATTTYYKILKDNDQYTVTEPRGKFILSYKAPKNSELYLSIEGVNIPQEKLEELDRLYFRTKTDKTYANVSTLRSTTDTYYFGIDGRLMNLGYHEKSSRKTRIAIDQVGTFTLGALNLYAVSMDNYEQYYQDRMQHALTNINVSTNKITGKITTDTNQMLLLTIPYSPGWTATIDGNEVTTYRANTMYTAIDVAPGSHDVVLTYRTPYLSLGITTSLISCVALLAIYMIPKYKYKVARPIEQTNEEQTKVSM